MLQPLTNTFGFETNCFVCEASNVSGLQIAFFHDVERGAVTASARLGSAYSGAPSLVHGGVLAAICDDAMAWAAIAVERRFALIAEARLSYLIPVALDQEITVTGRVIGRIGRQIWLSADVRHGEAVHVRAEARASIIGEELATPAGVTVSPDTPASP